MWGSKYPCRDHSFILGSRIPRSVNLVSSFYNKPISIYCLWMAQNGGTIFVQGQIFGPDWGDTVVLTSLALSMAVNTPSDGLDRAQDPQGVFGS